MRFLNLANILLVFFLLTPATSRAMPPEASFLLKKTEEFTRFKKRSDAKELLQEQRGWAMSPWEALKYSLFEMAVDPSRELKYPKEDQSNDERFLFLIPILKSTYAVETELLDGTDGTYGAFRDRYLSALSTNTALSRKLKTLKSEIHNMLATTDLTDVIENLGIHDFGRGVQSPLFNQTVIESAQLAQTGQEDEESLNQAFADDPPSPFVLTTAAEICAENLRNRKMACPRLNSTNSWARMRILWNASQMAKFSTQGTCGQWGLWPFVTYYGIETYRDVWNFQQSCYSEVQFLSYNYYYNTRSMIQLFYATLMRSALQNR